MDHFDLHAPFSPTGDQPEAIAKLVQGIRDGDHEQTLLGVTGSGKTYTIANVIAQVNKPTLVLAHNKILAAQLCSEFREFFPNNAVEYFVSYYDYYRKPIFPARIAISKKTPRSMTRSTKCGTVPQRHWQSEKMSSLSPAFPVSIPWAVRKNIVP